MNHFLGAKCSKVADCHHWWKRNRHIGVFEYDYRCHTEWPVVDDYVDYSCQFTWSTPCASKLLSCYQNDHDRVQPAQCVLHLRIGPRTGHYLTRSNTPGRYNQSRVSRRCPIDKWLGQNAFSRFRGHVSQVQLFKVYMHKVINHAVNMLIEMWMKWDLCVPVHLNNTLINEINTEHAYDTVSNYQDDARLK